MRHQINSLFAFLCIMTACEEFITTQKDQPNVVLARDTIQADGISLTKIIVTSDRRFAPNQELNISTTDGLLFETPNTDLVLSGQKEISVLHESSEYVAYLKSGLNANDDVLVFVTLNGHSPVEKKVVFSENKPSFLNIRINKDSLKLGIPDFVDIDIFLKSDRGLPTLDQKIIQKITIQPLTLQYQMGSIEVDTTFILEKLVYFDEVLFSDNDTLRTRLTPRILKFPDRLITEVYATITIQMASDSTLQSSETIRIIE